VRRTRGSRGEKKNGRELCAIGVVWSFQVPWKIKGKGKMGDKREMEKNT
jgi:hypothetical protein